VNATLINISFNCKTACHSLTSINGIGHASVFGLAGMPDVLEAHYTNYKRHVPALSLLYQPNVLFLKNTKMLLAE
jgi:hypothetical protein